MATDVTEMGDRQECQRCGKIVSSTQALYDHLNTKGACQGKKPKRRSGIVQVTDGGIVETEPHSMRDLYID